MGKVVSKKYIVVYGESTREQKTILLNLIALNEKKIIY